MDEAADRWDELVASGVSPDEATRIVEQEFGIAASTNTAADRWDDLVAGGMDPNEATRNVEQEFGVTAPGTEEVTTATDGPSEDRGFLRTAGGVAEQFARGVRRPIESVATGAVGLAGGVIPGEDPAERAAETMRRRFEAIREENAPETTAERIASGTGRVGGEVLTALAPGGAVARGGRAIPAVARAGQALARGGRAGRGASRLASEAARGSAIGATGTTAAIGEGDADPTLETLGTGTALGAVAGLGGGAAGRAAQGAGRLARRTGRSALRRSAPLLERSGADVGAVTGGALGAPFIIPGRMAGRKAGELGGRVARRLGGADTPEQLALDLGRRFVPRRAVQTTAQRQADEAIARGLFERGAATAASALAGRQADPEVLEGLTSTDPEREAVPGEVGTDIALGLAPGVGELQDVRDLVRGVRARDPTEVGLATLALGLPFSSVALLRSAIDRSKNIPALEAVQKLRRPTQQTETAERGAEALRGGTTTSKPRGIPLELRF